MRLLIIGLGLLIATPVAAQTDVFPAQPTSQVMDVANILTTAEEQALESAIKVLEDLKAAEIAVVTLPTIQDYEPYEVATAIGRAWGVGGQADIASGDPTRNHGVVMLVVPKVGNARGRCFIASGTGVEGWLTDAKAGAICRDDMVPHFRENDYAGGMLAGIATIQRHAEREIAARTPQPPPPPRDWTWFWIALGTTGTIILTLLGMNHWVWAPKRRAEEAKLQALRAEQERIRQLEYAKQQAEAALRAAEARAEAARRAEIARIAEAKRWAALTPEQQQAELAERERQRQLAEAQRIADEREAAARRKREDEARRKRQQEDDDRRRRDSYNSSSNWGGFSGSGGGGGGSSFGGGGGFSGGGGGSDW